MSEIRSSFRIARNKPGYNLDTKWKCLCATLETVLKRGGERPDMAEAVCAGACTDAGETHGWPADRYLSPRERKGRADRQGLPVGAVRLGARQRGMQAGCTCSPRGLPEKRGGYVARTGTLGCARMVDRAGRTRGVLLCNRRHPKRRDGGQRRQGRYPARIKRVIVGRTHTAGGRR